VLREQILASDLLPGDYARYRPLLADALCFFLERLPARRLRLILAQQAALPLNASTAQRLVALVRHAPALHKLGQVVAREPRLSVGFRKQLQILESLEPQTPPDVVARLARLHLRGRRLRGLVLGPPLAEGSVAVVVPFFLQYGGGLVRFASAVFEQRPKAASEQQSFVAT
jgi:ubiquinone biosynthesis protein